MIPEYGVFVLDPGGSSGLAWARVRDEGTVSERLAARTEPGSDTVSHPDWMEQAKEVVRRWLDFQDRCHAAGIPAYLVIEDFILTRFKSSDRTGLYPVWIAAAVRGYRNGLADSVPGAANVGTVWQLPTCMTYATDERLKRWGLWVRGREHERDAWRHLAFFIADKKAQQLRLAHARSRTRTHEARF